MPVGVADPDGQRLTERWFRIKKTTETGNTVSASDPVRTLTLALSEPPVKLTLKSSAGGAIQGYCPIPAQNENMNAVQQKTRTVFKKNGRYCFPS